MKATENLCPCCRTVKLEGHFYRGVGIQNGSRLPYCKDCCKEKFDKYSLVIGEDGAMWTLCGELGIPFIKNIWLDAKESYSRAKNGKDPIGDYIKFLTACGTIYQGFWDSDTFITQLTKNKTEAEESALDLNAMRKKWGTQEDYNEAYTFLEEAYYDYTNGLLEMDANLERRYRDLCLAEYAKFKAQESGDVTEIGKAQSNVASLLKLLKLDNFKDNKQSDEEKRVERMAWIIENTRPAECEDLEKYKNFSGFEDTWNDLKRCLQNLIAGTREYPDIPKNVM